MRWEGAAGALGLLRRVFFTRDGGAATSTRSASTLKRPPFLDDRDDGIEAVGERGGAGLAGSAADLISCSQPLLHRRNGVEAGARGQLVRHEFLAAP